MHRIISALTVIVGLCIIVAGQIAAQSLRPDYVWYQSNLQPVFHQQQIAVDLSVPGTAWAHGGNVLHRTTDGGMSWTPLTIPAFANLRDLDGTVAYGYRPGRFYVSIDNYLYRTDDNGANWQELTYPRGCSPAGSAIVVNPLQPDHVYVSNYNGGSRSTDGGATWSFPRDIIPCEKEPYGMYQFSTTTPQLVFKTEDNTLWRSSDDGATWQSISNGLPVDTNQPRIVLSRFAINPADASQITAIVDDMAYSTRDGGASWQQVGNLAAEKEREVSYDTVSRRVLIATDTGVFQLPDGAATATPLISGLPLAVGSSEPSAVGIMTPMPGYINQIISSNDRFLFVSVPRPVITEIRPGTVAVGKQPFTVVVRGGEFRPQIQGYVNDRQVETRLLNANEVELTLLASYRATPQTLRIQVGYPNAQGSRTSVQTISVGSTVYLPMVRR